MRTYTIVYSTQDDQVLVDTRQAASEPEAVSSFERDNRTSDILHVIEHHVPKVTVCRDGDHPTGAYSDGSVELLHVYTGNTAAEDAQSNGDNLMPGDRQAENLAYKTNDAFGFSLVEVRHHPEEARFDHAFVNDEERIQAFTQAVQEELES